jgi:hypothetical protein
MANACSVMYEPLEVEIVDGQRVIKKMKILSIEFFEERCKNGTCMVQRLDRETD